MPALPNAEIIIIGGGAVGCGVAYALTRAGKSDILLLEGKPELGEGTTSQGAGLCGQVRNSAERIRLAMHSVAIFRELERNSDVKPEWREVGSLRIALNDARASEFHQLKQAAEEAGLEAALVDRNEAKRRWPLMNFTQTTAVLWCPSDGYMTPRSVVNAYAHQCRKAGVQMWTDTRVEKVKMQAGRIAGIETNQGSAECRYLINAAGAHATTSPGWPASSCRLFRFATSTSSRCRWRDSRPSFLASVFPN